MSSTPGSKRFRRSTVVPLSELATVTPFGGGNKTNGGIDDLVFEN